MCVIIVKDKNGTLPKKETLQNCFDRNSHGAGFMYVESGKVVIDKGYMDFKSFYRHYKRLCRKFHNFENKNLVMHMRISTSGGIERENTHPFPMANNFKDMLKLYFRTDVGIAHNGIISAAKPSKEQEALKINDTMVFIKAYLNNIYQDWNECLESEAFMTGISIITGSKLAILDKDDNLRLVGDFKTFENTLYSNTSYEPSYSKKYSYNYDDYYDKYEEYGYYDSLYNQKYRDYEGYERTHKDYEYEDEFEEEVNNIILEDCDLVALDYESEYTKIANIRTQEDSIFIFDKEQCVLKEVDIYGKAIAKYYEAYVYVQKEQKVY